MPTISMFLGIVIRMNWLEYNPPHFHAEYQALGLSSIYSVLFRRVGAIWHGAVQSISYMPGGMVTVAGFNHERGTYAN